MQYVATRSLILNPFRGSVETSLSIFGGESTNKKLWLGLIRFDPSSVVATKRTSLMLDSAKSARFRPGRIDGSTASSDVDERPWMRSRSNAFWPFSNVSAKCDSRCAGAREPPPTAQTVRSRAIPSSTRHDDSTSFRSSIFGNRLTRNCHDDTLRAV